jgi:hypothetical protein
MVRTYGTILYCTLCRQPLLYAPQPYVVHFTIALVVASTSVNHTNSVNYLCYRTRPSRSNLLYNAKPLWTIVALLYSITKGLCELTLLYHARAVRTCWIIRCKTSVDWLFTIQNLLYHNFQGLAISISSVIINDSCKLDLFPACTIFRTAMLLVCNCIFGLARSNESVNQLRCLTRAWALQYRHYMYLVLDGIF